MEEKLGVHTMLNNKNGFGWERMARRVRTSGENENLNYLFFLTITVF